MKSLPNKCSHARTFQLVCHQSLASIINKIPKQFYKTADCSSHSLSPLAWTPSLLVYRGIPSDLRSRPEQSHHLPGSLLPWWLKAVYRVSNRHPTTFLGLCSPGDYRQPIESPMGEKLLKFTIYDCILRLQQKRCDVWRIYPFDCRVYLSSDICRMRWAD